MSDKEKTMVDPSVKSLPIIRIQIEHLREMIQHQLILENESMDEHVRKAVNHAFDTFDFDGQVEVCAKRAMAKHIRAFWDDGPGNQAISELVGTLLKPDFGHVMYDPAEHSGTADLVKALYRRMPVLGDHTHTETLHADAARKIDDLQTKLARRDGKIKALSDIVDDLNNKSPSEALVNAIDQIETLMERVRELEAGLVANGKPANE